jgi:hypothetical protein
MNPCLSLVLVPLMIACGEIARSPGLDAPREPGSAVPLEPPVVEGARPAEQPDFSAGCPATLAMPSDCGADSARCGNAKIIATVNAGTLSDFAIDDNFAYWQFHHPMSECKAAIYRSPIGGGSAELFAAVDSRDLEVHGSTVYWTDAKSVYAADSLKRTINVLGAVPFADGKLTLLARSDAGVIAYPANGAWEPVFYRVSPTSLTPIGGITTARYLGSVPQFDGTTLWFSATDRASPSVEHLQTMNAATGTLESRATNATTRHQRSIVTTDDSVYFTTGDWMSQNGSLFKPMALMRQEKVGRRVEQITNDRTEIIHSIEFADGEIFYVASSVSSASNEIRAVTMDGKTRRTLWRGAALPQMLRAIGDSVCFNIPPRAGYPEATIGGSVLRVAKASSI